MEDGLVDRIFPLRDRGNMEHRIDMDGPIKAPELAIRTFELGIAFLFEIAFDHELRIGRCHHAVCETFDHGYWLAAQSADKAELVDRRARGRREEIQGMRADR